MDFVLQMVLSSAVKNYVAPLIDLEDKQVRTYLYSAYFTLLLVIGTMYFFIWMKVEQQDRDEKNIRVEKPISPDFSTIMAAAKFVLFLHLHTPS